MKTGHKTTDSKQAALPADKTLQTAVPLKIFRHALKPLPFRVFDVSFGFNRFY